jgi:hypothetical protein
MLKCLHFSLSTQSQHPQIPLRIDAPAPKWGRVSHYQSLEAIIKRALFMLQDSSIIVLSPVPNAILWQKGSRSMRKTFALGLLLVLVVIVLVGCAAGPNNVSNVPNESGHVAGFWLGLWHGIIAPVTFAISLFSDKVSLYEVHNNGGWYDFGFLLGFAAFWGGGGSGAASARRSRS